MSNTPKTFSGWLFIIVFSVSMTLLLVWLTEKFLFKSSPTNVLWIWAIIVLIVSFIIGLISPEVQDRNEECIF